MSNLVVRLPDETEAHLKAIMEKDYLKTKNGAIIQAIDQHLYYRDKYSDLYVEHKKLKSQYKDLLDAISQLQKAQNHLNSFI